MSSCGFPVLQFVFRSVSVRLLFLDSYCTCAFSCTFPLTMLWNAELCVLRRHRVQPPLATYVYLPYPLPYPPSLHRPLQMYFPHFIGHLPYPPSLHRPLQMYCPHFIGHLPYPSSLHRPLQMYCPHFLGHLPYPPSLHRPLPSLYRPPALPTLAS